MRRITYLLLAVLLLSSMLFSVYAEPADKVGVIKAFNEKSITLVVDGKDSTYTIDKNTKVFRIDQEVDLLDVAKKGLKVTFRTSDNKLTYINISNMGAELQGAPRIAVSDLRINTTDSPTAPKETASIDSKTNEVLNHISTVVKELPIVEDTGFTAGDDMGYEGNEADLGDKEIIPGSLVVTLNGKELKIIDAKAEFDPAVVGDEVKFERVGLSNMLTFETNIIDKETVNYADVEKVLKVSYKKKMFEIYTTETNFLPVNNEAIIELNGKVVPLSKAMAYCNASLVRTNPEGEVIHLDAFYKDVTGRFSKLNKDQLTVNIVKNGRIIGQDIVTLSEAVTVYDKDGSLLTVSDLKVGDDIYVTTEPAEDYKVTSITKR